MYLKEHYVYAYYNEQGRPYYIGKGKGRRAYQKHLLVKRPTRCRIKILNKDLTDRQACDIENKLILKYGRKDLGTGILENRKDRDNPHSPESLERARTKLKILFKDPKRRARYSKMFSGRKLILDKKVLEQKSKKLSQTMKKLWQGSFRKTLKKIHQSKKFKDKMSKIRKEIVKRPEYKKLRSNIAKKYHLNPIVKERHRQSVKNWWAKRKAQQLINT